MRRLLTVAAWLALGATALGGLYWTLVNTPDANALMIGASALLLLSIVLVAAIVVGAALWLARGHGPAVAVARALRGSHWFLAAMLLPIFVWWDVRHTDAWVAEHAGEISAWFIARFGWEDVGWLFQIETWLSRWLRWALASLMLVAVLDTLQIDGPRALARTPWIRRALHWRTLAFTTLIFIVLFALPWQLVEWRPTLPPSSVEVVVAVLRLSAAAVLILVGCALLVSTVVDRRAGGLRRSAVAVPVPSTAAPEAPASADSPTPPASPAPASPPT